MLLQFSLSILWKVRCRPSTRALPHPTVCNEDKNIATFINVSSETGRKYFIEVQDFSAPLDPSSTRSYNPATVVPHNSQAILISGLLIKIVEDKDIWNYGSIEGCMAVFSPRLRSR